MEVSLVMFKKDGERRDFVLNKENTVIGRTSDCNFQIPLSIISRRHCQIIQKSGKVKIRDLGSSNGTYVNHKRVQEGDLNAGDLVSIGPVHFTVVIDGEPSTIKPVPTILNNVKKAAEPVAELTSEPKTETGSEIDLTQDAEEDAEIEIDLKDDSGPIGNDPLAALEAMAKKKN